MCSDLCQCHRLPDYRLRIKQVLVPYRLHFPRTLAPFLCQCRVHWHHYGEYPVFHDGVNAGVDPGVQVGVNVGVTCTITAPVSDAGVKAGVKVGALRMANASVRGWCRSCAIL